MPKDSSAQSGPTAGGNVRANSHWSNVAPGEYFTVTFEESDKIPAHLEQSQFIGKEVKLMRDSGSGFTVSCHDDWSSVDMSLRQTGPSMAKRNLCLHVVCVVNGKATE